MMFTAPLMPPAIFSLRHYDIAAIFDYVSPDAVCASYTSSLPLPCRALLDANICCFDFADAALRRSLTLLIRGILRYALPMPMLFMPFTPPLPVTRCHITFRAAPPIGATPDVVTPTWYAPSIRYYAIVSSSLPLPRLFAVMPPNDCRQHMFIR